MITQPGSFQVGRACLGARGGSLNGETDSPPGVYLIGKIERQYEISLRLAILGAGIRFVPGKLVRGGGRTSADRGIQPRPVDANLVASLPKLGFCNLQVLV